MKIDITLADAQEVKIPELKVGIMADSHGHPAAITGALAYLIRRKCRPIVHLGDICDSAHPETVQACVEPLQEYAVTAIKGNNDHTIVANCTDHRQNSVPLDIIRFLQSLPLVACFQKGVFTHSLPFYQTLGLSCMIRNLGPREAGQIFTQFAEQVVFRGHSHTPEIIWQQGHETRAQDLYPGGKINLAERMPAVVTCGALTDGFCMIWEPMESRIECRSYR